MLAQGVAALLLLEAAGLCYLRSERRMGAKERRARATLFGVRRLGARSGRL